LALLNPNKRDTQRRLNKRFSHPEPSGKRAKTNQKTKMSTEEQKAEKETLTITLTGRAPVRIVKEDWPIIASSEDKDYDNQYEFQANRISRWTLTVRQHSDGRVIVRGIYSYASQLQNSRNYDVRGGELLPSDTDLSLSEAITRVGAWMAKQAHYGEDAERWTDLIRDCIGDLPPEEI
jgi:hypothetical protein